MAAHQAPPSLGFSRQEHWSGLPFPSPMHESEKWKWSRSVVSDSLWPHGLQPTRLLHPWDFPGKRTGVGCHHLLWIIQLRGFDYRYLWVQIITWNYFLYFHHFQCPPPQIPVIYIYICFKGLKTDGRIPTGRSVIGFRERMEQKASDVSCSIEKHSHCQECFFFFSCCTLTWPGTFFRAGSILIGLFPMPD